MLITVEADEATPTHEDGTTFPFVLVHSGQNGTAELSVADTNTELLGALIPGYADLAEDFAGDAEALVARYTHAVGVATALQADLAAQARHAGRFSPADESEDVLSALFTEKNRPFTGITGADGEHTVEWTHDVPLVLIESDYHPFTKRRTPTGKVVWLRPGLETTYLQSLADVGLVEYLVHQDT